MYPIRVQKVFQFETSSVLQPISEESPTGESLRYEGTYDKIREARTEDDPVLSRGVWKQPMKRADWSDVAALSLDALERRTKDLQIAAWLTDAWLHLYGFLGLREGLRVIAGLSEAFWDNLYPQAESGDSLEYRVAPIDWINDKLAPVIRLLALTEPASDDVKAYCWDDWESSTRPRPADSPNQGATQAQFQQSALLTSTGFYLNLLEEVESAAAAASRLEAVLTERCGDEAPSLRQLANALESIRGLIVSILNLRDVSLPAPAQPSTAVVANSAPEAPHHDDREPFSGRSIRSRDDAYRCLAEAADFLARTEPHSPTPYLVRRAITWGGMRLEDLLPELVRSQDELLQINRLLQIGRTGRE